MALNKIIVKVLVDFYAMLNISVVLLLDFSFMLPNLEIAWNSSSIHFCVAMCLYEHLLHFLFIALLNCHMLLSSCIYQVYILFILGSNERTNHFLTVLDIPFNSFE